MKPSVIYLYSIKGLINRFRKYPVKILIIGVVLGSIIILPSVMVRDSLPIEIPQNYIQAFFCFYFAYSLISVFFKWHTFRSIQQNFISLLTLVPDKTKSLYFLLFCENALKSAVSYGAIFWVISLYMRKSILEVLSQLCLLFLSVIALVAVNEITSFLSLIPLWKGIRIFCLILGIALVLNGILELKGLVDRSERICVLPQYMYASIILLIWGEGSDSGLFYLWIGIFLLLQLGIFIFLLCNIKLRAYHILQKAVVKENRKTRSIMERLSKAIFFLPVQLKLLIIREVIQIIKEKSALLTVFWQSMAASGIMLFASMKVEPKAIFIGLIVAVSYVGFIIALYSIPRDIRTIWIIKTVGVDKKNYILSKFLASYVAVLFVSVPVSVSYLFIGYILKPEALGELLCICLFCMITAMPLSNMLGLIISTLMPFEIVEKNKRITYKFSGLEGVFLTILIFLGVVPSYACYTGLRESVIVWLYVLYCLLVGIVMVKVIKTKLIKMY